MSVKEELKKQITGGLKNANFPINTPEELLNAFPMGADTTCQAGDVKITAGEAGKLLTKDDFPFKNAETVANTILNRADL